MPWNVFAGILDAGIKRQTVSLRFRYRQSGKSCAKMPLEQEEILLAAIDQNKIRNFCIIAHIDHGKSTLADRIIEKTGLLDQQERCRHRFWTTWTLKGNVELQLKSQAVRIVYKAKDGEEYIFNLIDTPGHVDFNYEVSRSLAACDGAILSSRCSAGNRGTDLGKCLSGIWTMIWMYFQLSIKLILPSADPERVIE